MILERLKHGKALCGKVFANFVETFNHLVDFSENLTGDADSAKDGGHISVDRTNPDHPIIRCSGCPNASGGSGGSDDPDSPESPEDPYGAGVTSLNGETGALQIVGGEAISVQTDGKTIVINYVEGKKSDNSDPCEHPGDGNEPDLGGGGGVSLDLGTEHGNPCNCE